MIKIAIIYDISNDKLRTKFAQELMCYGMRVQYSVFEADVTKKELHKIEDLAHKYANSDDKVSIYELLNIQRFGEVEYIENYDLIF